MSSQKIKVTENDSPLLSNTTVNILCTILLCLIGVALISVFYKNIHANKQTNTIKYNQSNTVDLNNRYILISVLNRGVFLLDTETGKETIVAEMSNILSSVMSNKTIAVLVGENNKEQTGIYIYDLNNLSNPQYIYIDHPQESNSALKISGNGKHILVGVNDTLKRGKVLHYTRKAHSKEWKLYKEYYYPTEKIYSVGFSVTCNRDCSRIAIGCPAASKVILIANTPIKNKEKSNLYGPATEYHDMFKFDKNTYILYGLDQMILDYGYSLDMDDKGDTLVIGTSGNRTHGCFYIINITDNFTAYLISNKDMSSVPCQVAISGNGDVIACCDMKGLINIYDTKNALFTSHKISEDGVGDGVVNNSVPSMKLNKKGDILLYANQSKYYIYKI